MKNVAEAAVDDLARLEHIQRWPAGTTLFVEGEQPRGVYVIHSGEVEMVFSSRNGVRKPLRVAGRGEVLGLGDAVSNREHDCTATTRTTVRVGFIPLSDLSRMLDQMPELWLSIARMLSTDLNACWASMRSIGAPR